MMLHAALPVSFSIACCLASPANAQTPPGFPKPPHQVLLLGTFHFDDPGQDEFKPKVAIDVKSESRQRELAEVVDVLARFRPTKIAVEVMAALQPDLDRAYTAYRRSEYELPAGEPYQIGFRLARNLQHDRVCAIDAPQRWYEPHVDPSEYARAHGQQDLVESPWYELYRGAAEREDLAKAGHTIGETLLALNRPERLRLSHGVYLVGTFGAGVGAEYPGADARTAWFNRNLRIFANLRRITTAPHERILVVIGAGHVPILRHCVECSPEYELVEPASLVAPPPGAARPIDGAALIREHMREFEHDRQLGGAGLSFLLEQAAGAQFVLLGEPHNTDQVDEFAGMLLAALHERLGFEHLVVEQDGCLMDRFADAGVRGNLAAVRGLAAQYPRALHFGTDAELALLAKAGGLSTAAAPVWGVDRVLDTPLGLEALLAATERAPDRERIAAVLDGMRRLAPASEQRELGGRHDDLDALLTGLSAPAASPMAELLGVLRQSRANLTAWRTEHGPGEAWGHAASEQREEIMKTRFLCAYRRATAAGEVRPKALVKMGHMHVVRGLNPSGVATLGTFLADVARQEGGCALSISIQCVNAPGGDWSLTDHAEYALFHPVADASRWRLVDLRPLRGHVVAGSLTVTAEVRDLVLGFDLLLLLGGTERGRATWQR